VAENSRRGACERNAEERTGRESPRFGRRSVGTRIVVVALSDTFAGYSRESKPLAEYGMLIGLFSVAYGGLGLVAARTARRGIPERYSLADVVIVGAATHKLSRILTKDRVTSVFRAPFTRFEDDAGHGEVDEESRGTGMQKAVGELVTCPYCLGLWVSGAMTIGLVRAPRATRMVSFTLAVHTLSDVLQLAYRAAEDAAG
jgi:Protein of unknown function (DUF1360)